MTTRLELMKCFITNSLELEDAETTDVMRAYYRGKAMGALELSFSLLSGAEYGKLWAHYKIQDARFR